MLKDKIKLCIQITIFKLFYELHLSLKFNIAAFDIKI